MKPVLRRGVRLFAVAAALAVVLAAALLAVTLRLLQPADGDWQTELRIGPWQRAVNLPVLLRFALHPLARPLLDGRVLHTRFGRWQLQRRGDGWLAVCAPCTIQLRPLGPAPLHFARAQLTLAPIGADRFAGRLQLAEGVHELALDWRAQLGAHDATLELTLPPTPAQRVIGVLARDLAEAPQLRVEGRVAATLRLRLPDGQWTIDPRIDDLWVDGLHTERLSDAQPPPACRALRVDGESIGGWLPRALVAAEDARFFEHPGYDLAETLAALRHNQTSDRHDWRGGSTLTQQLAKIVFTGDDRSATRKLRELLYAVEMERTLGKARILQLYLALAPWGEGVCGAERAAQVYLGKPAGKLGPVSSAWLVSLLRNPDAQLRALTDERRIDRERVRQILAGMRGLKGAQRALAETQVEDWTP